MSSNDTNDDNGKRAKEFVERVKKLKETNLGQKDVVPIQAVGEKKPPGWWNWTPIRDNDRPPLTNEEVETIFSKPDVGRAAIILSKSSFVIDAEGEGLAVQGILEQRMSEGLRDKSKTTRITITPNGKHKHFLLSPKAFPDGIEEMLCWSLQRESATSGDNKKRPKRKSGDHAPGSGELRILSQFKYCIEIGAGYEVMNPEYETAIELNEDESNEIVGLYRSFKVQQDVIRMMIGGEKKESLLKYWSTESNLRHDIALGLAGTLWHTQVPENFAYDLIYYICKVTNDEELEDRLTCVRDTYRRKGDENEPIKGIVKLLPALDGNKEIIQRIYEGLETLGYQITRAKVTFKGSPTAKKYYGSVDNLEGGTGGLPGDDRRNPREGLGGASTSKADVIVDLCTPYIKDLFVDKFEVPFALIEINNRLETIEIKRNRFKQWIRRVYYEQLAQAVPQQALDSATGVFEAQATLSDKIKLLSLRVSDGKVNLPGVELKGNDTSLPSSPDELIEKGSICIYYDLCNQNRNIIEITQNGWTVKNSRQLPSMFYRYKGQGVQIMPSHTYPGNVFDEFMDLVNTVVKDDQGNTKIEETKVMRMLLKCYIVALLIPNINRVMLLLCGEEGSAKTAFMELVKMLIDPSGALTLSFPRDIAEIVQQIAHNYIAYYDNVSVIRDWLSDFLCRVATGMGFSKRELWTNDEDITYQYIRSIGISAIHLPGSKPDFLDRGLIIKFSFIHEDFRRNYKDDVLPTFQRLKPQLLGYIFDILAKSIKMKIEGKVRLEARSRMADWEEWGEIIARCMDYEPNEFTKAYTNNRKLQSDLILEDRPVARVIVRLVEKLEEGGKEWTGYTSALLEYMEVIAEADLEINTKREPLWPKSPSKLSYRLNEVKSNLRKLGVEIYTTWDKSGFRVWHISQSPGKSKPDPSEPDPDQKSTSENMPNLRKVPTVPQVPPVISPSEDKGNSAATDGTVATDGTLHTSHISEKSPKKVKPPSVDLRKTIDLNFDTNQVQIVNLMQEQCDINISRQWRKGKNPNLAPPLAGMSGYLGNPYTILKLGQEPTKPWECKTREEALAKFEEWLYHGTEVVHDRDPVEYRRFVLTELPGHYKWGCFCAPDHKCHGDILRRWLRLKLRLMRRYRRKKDTGSTTKGGDTK